MINFIADIIDSAGNAVDSTGNATEKIVVAANPLTKRENETTEDYKIRLTHFENQKQLHQQSNLEQ